VALPDGDMPETRGPQNGDEALFPVERSLLSAQALNERVLSKYGLDQPITCNFWRRGINDGYLVRTGPRKLVLRVSPAGWRSWENLEAELDLLEYLWEHKVCVPRAVQQSDGTRIQVLRAPEGPRHAVLFTFVPGQPCVPEKLDARRFGRAVARFHTLTDGYSPNQALLRFEPEDMVDQPLARLEPLLPEGPQGFGYLTSIAPTLKQAACQLPREPSVYGICHGDVNDGNVHFFGQDRWALLDFEYAGYGWRVFDIGTFYSNQLYQLGKTGQARPILDAFLDGYQSVRTLSEAELDALDAFVILRQIWLMGVGARNVPIIGLAQFREWAMGHCLPAIRDWMKKLPHSAQT
jgi:Ser/Thr protein kinase RdoA (MazF antagonist)